MFHVSRFTFLLQHAVQGSNLPFPVLETSAPPLELTARPRTRIWNPSHRFSMQCVGKDSNLRGPRRTSRVTVCCNRRSATYALGKDEVRRMKDETNRCSSFCLHPSSFPLVSVAGFEPATPCARGTCATKLRHTLNQYSRRDLNPRSPVEGRGSCHWTTGAFS